MPKITISLADLQSLSDAAARCFTEDLEDYKLRMAFAFLKKDINDKLGPESPANKVRTDIFAKYGTPVEGGYTMPDNIEKRTSLVGALEQAYSEKVNVRFPDLTPDLIEKAKLPMTAANLALLINLGVIKDEENG